MIEYLKSFFSDEFMPHGHCYLWKPEILWMHAISDAIIFLAYLMIPTCLVYIVYKTKYKVPYHHIFVLFSLFILACGTTHFMEIINIWKSEYFISGLIKVFTAIVSIMTAFSIIPFIPKVIEIIKKEQEKNNA